MKKKIAVLMAAATAVTTVAPAVANAEVTTKSNQSLDQAVKAAQDALAVRYKDNDETGINFAGTKTIDSNNITTSFNDYVNVNTTSGKADDYLNSRYAVILRLEGTKLSAGDLPASIVPIDGNASYGGANTRFTSEFISDRGATNNFYFVKETDGLRNFLEMATIQKGLKASIAIIDKGYDKETTHSYRETRNAVITYDKDRDGMILYGKKENYAAMDLVNALVKNIKSTNPLVKSVKYYANGDKEYYVDKSGTKVNNEVGEPATNGISYKDIEVTLINNNVVKYRFGDDYPDLSKPVTATGEVIKVDEKNDSSVYDGIVGFKAVEYIEEGNDPLKVDIRQSEDYTVYEIGDVQEHSYTLPTYYSAETGYTDAGADYVNTFHEFNKVNGKALNIDGTSYLLDNKGAVLTAANNAKIVPLENGGYELQVTVPVKNSNDQQKKTTLLLKYTSNVQADLAKFKDDLLTKTEDVVAGRFKNLSGLDRYQTAIEISKEAFDGKLKDGKNNYADTVVITGGTALLDGLSAAPLASANNATLLLASPKSGLSQATIDEIGRATDNKLYKKTVYIVGGYNSVPASVDKVLQDKFGAVVIRLAGDDRYATSKQVAERLVYDGNVNGSIFYVGGNGAADAMSVAPVAATYTVNATTNKREVAPILVTRDKALDQQTRNFLMTKVIKSDTGKSYVIGGLNTLGTAFYKDAVAVASTAGVKRLSGDDRYATNVKVVNEFYTAGATDDNKIIKTEGLFVASGMTNYLVDAQTAGSFAATKKAPILLAGSKLTDAQIDLLKKPSTATANPFYTAVPALGDKIASNVYQIGGVVSADAMKVVVDKFGL